MAFKSERHIVLWSRTQPLRRRTHVPLLLSLLNTRLQKCHQITTCGGGLGLPHRALKGPLEEVILSPLVQRWSRINGGGEREEVDTRGDGAVGCEEAVEAVAVEEALVHEIEGELTNCEDLGLTEVCQPVYQPVCQRVLIIASLNLTEPDQIQLNLTKHRGVRGPKQHTHSLPHFVRRNLSKP